MPAVTIATVALNAADDLPLTLESALLQDFTDREILVVDGASWDDTPKVLERYADVIDRIEVVEDAGVFAAMNHAASIANGEYIIFLNAADRFHTARAISKLWARKRDAADIVYGNHIYRSGGIDHYKVSSDFRAVAGRLREGQLDGRWHDRFPGHQATFTRTELLRRMPFDTTLRIVADHELLLRAHYDGANMQYVDELVSVYVGGGMSARRFELCKLEWNAVYRRYSELADRVDAFLFDTATPFLGLGGPMTGSAAYGLAAAPDGFRTVAGEGFRLIAPAHRAAAGLRLVGRNEIPRQRIDFLVGDQIVASEELATGEFSAEVVFEPELPPQSAIDVRPREAMRADDEAAIIAFRLKDVTFVFELTIEPRRRFEPLAFKASASEECGEHLGSTWYGLEDTHVWSRGRLGEVLLASHENVAELAFVVRGNPAAGDQRLTISVNGEEVGEGTLDQNHQEIVVPVSEVWRGNGATNRVSLLVDRSRTAGSDPRDLGVALLAAELR